MRLTKRISLTLSFLFIALAFTIQIGYSATQKTFTLNWDNPVFRYEENALNDSSTTKDLLFSTSENKTVWIRLPKNSTILFANISIIGQSSPTLSSAIQVIHSLSVDDVTTTYSWDEIVVATDNYIKLLNNSGSEIWNYNVITSFNDVTIGNLSSDTGKEVVAGASNSKIYMFNSSGNKIWDTTIGGPVNGIATGDVNTTLEWDEIAVAGNNQVLYLFNSSGQQIWNYSSNSPFKSIATGNLSSDTGKEVVAGTSSSNSTVFLINSSGMVKWSKNIGGSIDINDIATGDVNTTLEWDEIAVAGSNGTVFLLNSNGNILWVYTTVADVTINTVVIGDVTDDPGGEIILGSDNNNIYILNASGILVWSYTTSNAVHGIDVGNLTADPGNEIAAGTNLPATYNLYILNFQYYPTNTSLDIGNDGDYDWTNSGKLRISVNIPNSTLTSAIQDSLNACTSQVCNVSFVFHSDYGGDLNITLINITYDYNASDAINSSQINNTWARTSNTLVNESIGNQSINISYYSNPANTIEVRYVKINSTATACSFGGISYSNTTINGQNVCNLTTYRNVNSGGSLPASDLLWDNSMSAGIPIYENETSGTITGTGTWTKNVTIWNETTTVFYNVTANISINAVYISDAGLYVEWYSNGTLYRITPTSSSNTCNSTNPTYEKKTIGIDDFYVCKQDTTGDSQIDFFKWKQPHTSQIVYTVNGTTNHPAGLSNANVTPSSGKWNITNFNFTVFVNDSVDNDNVTVNFWLKVDELKWEMKESKNVSGSGTVWFNYTANESWVGVNTTYYMFEYEDVNSSTGEVYHTWQNTSNYTGLTVLKHNVSIIYISGNNTNVNKTGANTTFLSVVINDTDLNRNVSSANCGFWITTNGINFILANTTLTNATGYCNFSFDPNSTYYAGQQWWIAGTYQDNNYYDTNSTNYTVNVFGELRVNFTDYFINRNFTRGSNINFLAKLIDEGNNVVSVLGYNCTWYINGSGKANSTTNSSGYCNYTWPTGCPGSGLDSTLGAYIVNVSIWGSVSPYYTIIVNQSNTVTTLKDNLSVSIITPVSNQIVHTRDTVSFNSTVTDSCGAPSGYIVGWYLTKPDLCPTVNPVAVGDNTTWQINATCYPRSQNVIANASGNLYYSNQSTIQINIYGWSSIDIKDPISNQINRTSFGEIYNVTCYVGDVNLTRDVSDYLVNFWYSNSTVEQNIGRNLTTSTGNATYGWNVSSALLAEGTYTFKCNISDNSTIRYNVSVPEDSLAVDIIGNSDSQAPQFLEVTATSAIQYVQNITINANISDLYGVDKVWVNITFPNGTTNFTRYLTNTSTNNKRGIWNISLNMTAFGDYDFILYANDTTGNLGTTTGWFEVYLPLILTGNITNWNGNTNTTAVLTFYRNGTRNVIHRVNTNSSYAYYNLTVHKRLYDLEVRVFNHTITFYGVNTTATAVQQFNTTNITNITNPLNFTDILVGWISPAKYIHKLAALDINSILVNDLTTVTLNYSSAYSSIDNENDVRISKCTSWSYSNNNCSSWGDPTGTPDTTTRTVSINTTSLSVYAASETAICGNGRCQQSESCGETYYCPGDCGSCPSGGNTGNSGGGGGGGAVIAQCGNNICETGENRDNCPQDCGSPDTLFSLRTNLTEIQVDMGDENAYALWITNNVNSNLNTSISVVGTVSKFVTLEKTTLTVGPKKEEIVKIYVKIPNDADPGVYTGQLTIVGNDKTQNIPVTMTVSLRGEVYLDVVVQALDKKVNINDTAKFHITLYDMGFRKRLTAILSYIIKEYDTEKIIYEENETKFIESTQSFQKRIPLSDINNITAGRYFFEVRVRYDSKTASALDDFEVIKSFWTTQRVNRAIIIVLVTTSAVSILYGRKKYIQWKLAKARYIFPLDFNKLPKGRVWLGKIAETNKRAYFDMNDLKTHILTAGATGSGKSVSACIFVEELLREKIPVIVFDPTAQWTGFVRPCRDTNLLKYYKEFGLSINDTRPYTGMIYEITDPNVNIDFKKYMNPGEITVFTLNKLKPGQYDIAVRNIIDMIFAQGWEESTKIKMVVVFDEVHRLLERYGGTGGYVSLEKACREFRKWGIGLIMASQVLSDFKEAIKGNVLTEIQLHTKSLGDLSRIEKKYGLDYVKRVTKLEVGVGMMQNPKYNDGRPWFIAFRPTFHEPHKISDVELEIYKEYTSLIEIIEANIEAIEKSGRDVFDLRTELKLAKDKLKKGRFRMAKIYIDSLRKHLNIGEANT